MGNKRSTPPSLAEREARARRLLPEVRAVLESREHPRIAGQTLYDYVVWCLGEARSQGGRIAGVKIIERAWYRL